MRILIGYFMRSGSTLLQHVLDGHTQVSAYGDLTSAWGAMRMLSRVTRTPATCLKPPDLVYLRNGPELTRHFDKCIWLSRDPRDSYLSAIESGYAYMLWRRGWHEHGIDLGLLERWRRIYDRYLHAPERWYLLRYEDLVAQPTASIRDLLAYLELPYQRLFPFGRCSRAHGGDYKVRASSTVESGSRARFRRELDERQLAIFDRELGPAMARLGYPAGIPQPEANRVAAG